MYSIQYDDETRGFSVVEIETRSYGVMSTVGNFAKSAKGMAAIGGAAGTGAGVLLARNSAKKKAAAMGLEPGTPEYRSYMRKQMAKGAVGGAAVGAGAGLLTKGGITKAGQLNALMKRNKAKGIKSPTMTAIGQGARIEKRNIKLGAKSLGSKVTGIFKKKQ